MNGTDDRDARLRKLFSRLPSVGAPGNFEERVARAVARDRDRRRAFRSLSKALGVPAMALLLVGVISLLVFRSGPEPATEPILPAADTAASPAGAGGGDRESTVPGEGMKTSAPPPSEPSVPRSVAPGTSPRRTGDSPGAVPAPPPLGRAKAGAAAPPRLMMEAAPGDSLASVDSLPASDSIGIRDSLARRDTVADPGRRTDDSLRTAPDSLRSPVPPRNRSKPGTSP